MYVLLVRCAGIKRQMLTSLPLCVADMCFYAIFVYRFVVVVVLAARLLCSPVMLLSHLRAGTHKRTSNSTAGCSTSVSQTLAALIFRASLFNSRGVPLYSVHRERWTHGLALGYRHDGSVRTRPCSS
jgi:hypothetical protein